MKVRRGLILETPRESEKGTDNDENAGFGCAVIYPREDRRGEGSWGISKAKKEER